MRVVGDVVFQSCQNHGIESILETFEDALITYRKKNLQKKKKPEHYKRWHGMETTQAADDMTYERQGQSRGQSTRGFRF